MQFFHEQETGGLQRGHFDCNKSPGNVCSDTCMPFSRTSSVGSSALDVPATARLNRRRKFAQSIRRSAPVMRGLLFL
jgi:hypothetical protein